MHLTILFQVLACTGIISGAQVKRLSRSFNSRATCISRTPAETSGYSFLRDNPGYAEFRDNQAISINGKMLGVNGKRSSLYTYIVEAVKRIKPKVFIAENVGGLLLKQNEYSLNKILEDFHSLGYNLSYQLYHAEDYGVPQTRERVIFVGTKKGLPDFVPPKPSVFAPITAYEALHDLEEHPQDKMFSHIWSNAKVSGEQGNRRLIADRPGYTMRAECHGNIQFHYALPRRISMREAARIQSFPDSFSFPCGLRETERQIGNAVPPVLAWHIANSVKNVIEGNKNRV